MNNTAPHNRLTNNINFEQGYTLRGVAMLMIILVHSLNEYEVYTSTLSQYLLIPMFGTLGCSLFFFMSGYGLFHSLHKKDAQLNWKYTYTHLSKLLTPLFIIYLASFIILPYTTVSQQTTPDYTKILTLSLPDGTDVWFLKTTLFNYITTILLCKAKISQTRKIAYIFIVQALLVAALYINKSAGFCYISNMSFAFGSLYAIQRRYNKKIIIGTMLLFATYYICINSGVTMAPLQIAGNISLCIIVAAQLKHIKRAPEWLLYIGKHSLSYYLLSIPIMWMIPSEKMHYTCYFLLNLLLTTIAVNLYNRLAKHLFK